MKKLPRFINLFLFAFGLVLTPAGFAASSTYSAFQHADRGYGDLRGLVDRAQSDLREAASLQHVRNEQMKRFDEAQQHLSEFDRKLTKGHFDKGRLTSAISAMQKILDKNTLQSSSRDMLIRDVSDLRAVREHRY
jgi:cellobiose-specific phosphotransferase system component IIA